MFLKVHTITIVNIYNVTAPLTSHFIVYTASNLIIEYHLSMNHIMLLIIIIIIYLTTY